MLLTRTESCDVKAVLVKKPKVLAKVEDFLLDADMMPSGSECFTLPGQLRLIDQMKKYLIEEAQQPGLAGLKLHVFKRRIPYRQGAAHKLVASRRIHAVDAHVHTTDAYGALCRKVAGRVVLGTEQAMARIDGHRTGRSQINVAQAKHHVAGCLDRLLHLGDF